MFSVLFEGGTLTPNKGRRAESTGEETRCKSMGGESVNRPQLPRDRGGPRREEQEGSQVGGGP